VKKGVFAFGGARASPREKRTSLDDLCILKFSRIDVLYFYLKRFACAPRQVEIHDKTVDIITSKGGVCV
jgi:hypothetical protein